MQRLRWMLLGLLGLGMAFLLGGCFPGPAGPVAPAPPGAGLSCVVLLAMVLACALVAGVAVYLVWNKVGRGTPRPLATKGPEESAEEVARRRYAGGEITYEELQEILRHLEETRGRKAV